MRRFLDPSGPLCPAFSPDCAQARPASVGGSHLVHAGPGPRGQLSHPLHPLAVPCEVARTENALQPGHLKETPVKQK